MEISYNPSPSEIKGLSRLYWLGKVSHLSLNGDSYYGRLRLEVEGESLKAHESRMTEDEPL